MAARGDIDALLTDLRSAAEFALFGEDHPGVWKAAMDALDTAKALPPADREAAADLTAIAKLISRTAWKSAARDPRIRTKVLDGLRGR